MALHDVYVLAIKAVAGGALVVVFALISEAVSPKRFAGLFGAAPAVALAGLTITVLDKGALDAHESGLGMLAGSAGMVAYAACVVPLLHRLKSNLASATALVVWLAVAAAVAVPVLS
jgi:uncharacterized membrane protein (GlpM family)